MTAPDRSSAPIARNHAGRPELWANVADTQWNDWQWQQQNRVRTREELAQFVELSSDEWNACERAGALFNMAITPYYASLIDPADAHCPIRLQAIPQLAELRVAPDELEDPLGEEAYMPVPGITHRYPDRVLFYTTHNCPVYCRHCLRKRKVGDPQSAASKEALQVGIDYIARTPAVKDVLVSGGDPLTFSDARLDDLLGRLAAIEHLDIIRIATRNPVTLPQRVTPELVDVFRRHQPIYVNTHFNHPRECTPEAARALTLLADGGCVVGNQMVLLRGVNDDPETVERLNRWLLKHRCRPYYIFQCDPAQGISHFRTPVERGIEILRELRGRLSGLAIPHYVVDLPGGGGKVPLEPTYLESREGGELHFRNYQGAPYTYVDGK